MSYSYNLRIGLSAGFIVMALLAISFDIFGYFHVPVIILFFLIISFPDKVLSVGDGD